MRVDEALAAAAAGVERGSSAIGEGELGSAIVVIAV
jgi:hypothetical protein